MTDPEEPWHERGLDERLQHVRDAVANASSVMRRYMSPDQETNAVATVIALDDAMFRISMLETWIAGKGQLEEFNAHYANIPRRRYLWPSDG